MWLSTLLTPLCTTWFLLLHIQLDALLSASSSPVQLPPLVSTLCVSLDLKAQVSSHQYSAKGPSCSTLDTL